MPRAFDVKTPAALHDPTRSDLNWNISKHVDLAEIHRIYWEGVFTTIGEWFEEKTGINILDGFHEFLASFFAALADRQAENAVDLQEFLAKVKDHFSTVLSNIQDRQEEMQATWKYLWDAVFEGDGLGLGLLDFRDAANALVSKATVAHSNALTGLAAWSVVRSIEKGRLTAGANLIPDPSFENSDTLYGGERISSEQAYMGTKSLKLVANGTYSPYGLFRDDSTGSNAIHVSPGDVFYVEFMVRGAATNTQTNPAVVGRLELQSINKNGTVIGWHRITFSPSTEIYNDTWVQIKGYVTLPLTATSMTAWLMLDPGFTVGETFYFDSLVLKEYTHTQTLIDKINAAIHGDDAVGGNAIDTVRSNFQTAWARLWDGLTGHSNTSAKLPSDLRIAAAGVYSTANTADSNANTAISSAQTITDGVNQAVDGGSSTGAAHSTVKTKLQTAWAKFWDGLSGNTGSSSKLPSDVYTAAAAVKSTADTASTNASTGIANAATAQSTANSASSAASTAQSTANTANSTANTATTNLQTTVDSVVQAVDGGSSTGAAHSTVKTKLQTAWAKFWDGLSGNTGSTSKLPSDVYTAAAAVKSTADTASSNASTGIANAAAAQGTANTAKTLAVQGRATGDNLCPNPSFENQTYYVGTGSNGGATYSTEQARTGSYSLKMVGVTGQYVSNYIMTTDTTTFSINVLPGESFEITFWVRGKSTNTKTGGWIYAGAEVKFTDGSYTWVSPAGIGGSTSLNGVWTKVSGVATMPANASTATFYISLNLEVESSEVYYFDDVSVRVFTQTQNTIDYINQAVDGGTSTGATHPTIKSKLQLAWSKIHDGLGGTSGSTTKIPADVYTVAAAVKSTSDTASTNASTGIANAATAQGTANVAKVAAAGALRKGGNLACNPNAELSPWYHSDLYSTEQKRSGTSSFKTTMNGSSYFTHHLVSNETSELFMPVVPGGTYYMEAYVWGKSTNAATAGSIYFQTTNQRPSEVYDNTGDYASVVNAGTALNGKWTKVTGRVTLPADCVQSQFYLVIDNSVPAGNVYYVDDLQLVEWSQTQNTVDYINQAVDGGTATGAAHSSIKTKFLAAWSKIADGLGGTSGSTTKLPSDVYTVAAAVKSTSDTASANASTGIANAAAAQTTANVGVMKAKHGSNLVYSPDFEDTSVVRTPWANLGSAAGYSTEQKYTGTRSFKMVADNYAWSGGGNAGLGMQWPFDKDTQLPPVSPGTTYYMECWVFPHASNGTQSGSYYLELYCHDSTGSLGDYWSAAQTGNPASLTKGQWNKLSGYVTIPAGYNQAAFYFWTQTANLGDAWYIDNVIVREVTDSQIVTDNVVQGVVGGTGTGNLRTAIKTYVAAVNSTANTGVTNAATAQSTANTGVTNAATADGKAVAAQTTANTANTTANKASGITTALARRSANLCSDPGFENTNMYWASNGPTRSSELPMSGTYSAKFVSNNTWLSVGLTVDGTGQVFPNASVNDTYYCEFYVRGAAGNGSTNTGAIYCQIVGYDAAGYQTEAPVSIWGGSLSTYKNTWYKVSGYCTLTNASTVQILPLIGMSNDVPAGYTFYVDQVTVREVSEGYVAKTNAAAAQSTANTGVANAATADAKAVTAQGQAGNAYLLASGADGKAVAAQTTANTASTNANFAKGWLDFKIRAGANIVVDGGFEADINRFPFGTAGTGVSTDTAYKGSRCAKLIGKAGDYSGIQLVTNHDSGAVPIPCAPGDVYYVEFYYRGIAGNSTNKGYPFIQFNCDLTDGGWAGVNSGSFAVTRTSSTSWTKAAGYLTIPALTYQIWPVLYLGHDNPTSDVYYVDQVVIREVTEGNVAKVNAAAAQSTANTGVANAATADGKAVTAQTNHGTLVDYINNALSGNTALSGTTLSTALGNLQGTYGTLGNHSSRIQALEAKKAAAAAKGTLFYENFSTYSDGALPSDKWTVTYSGAGTSTIGVAASTAQWLNTNNADRDAKIIYNTATATDYQILRGTMSTPPDFPINGGTPKFHAIGRVSADGNTFVWARGYATGWLTYRGEIGCTVNGNETIWASNISLKWDLDMTFYIGVGSNPRQYQVYSGQTKVVDYTESGTTSQLGASYRKWGSIAQIRAGYTPNGPRAAGALASVSVADNAPVVVTGSTARLARRSTSTVSFVGAWGDTSFDSFWDAVPYESLDVNADTSGGTFKVSEAKTYIINVRAKLGGGPNSNGRFVLLVSQDNGSTWAETQYGPASVVENNSSIAATFIQYLPAGAMVKVKAQQGGITVSVLTGSAMSWTLGSSTINDSAESYFSITGAID